MSLDNTPSPRCGGAHNGEVAIGERPYFGEPLGKPGSLLLQVAEITFFIEISIGHIGFSKTIGFILIQGRKQMKELRCPTRQITSGYRTC